MGFDINIEKNLETCLSNPFPATDSMENSQMSFENGNALSRQVLPSEKLSATFPPTV